ncbi:aminomethyl-transferring glycine dehydrogenase subunit GcvPB [Sporanaerobacter sp. PP17-6a]|jgi:glycine dehydrogenase subunit 2|uniref:aminomethyl-transferring glycine dehydrogenase subunit GcvPB n=1 Tax=Sporanaerobacter sp. PP17-6a TaxID=1891289 RepID=UPI00089FB194|nr:aminomethyl-transferring glycine dehydrogenase subunit GcvPB [Sporanaerobacter sp. PP17-6a]MBE6082077.1 glycine dehydrogenase subunit 2 [Tissierellaceae bacterium]SCL86729.1 putative glycine dehydrogenase [decarboxylating] subunit 2 [Sporanaerobacter sp. PP17-6a]
MKEYNKLIFEISRKGRKGYSLPENDVPHLKADDIIPENLLSKNEINLPEVSEVDIVRHYTQLGNKNYGVDTGFYPLGSCTMKYNPKVNEEVAALSGFTNIHPYENEEKVQGALELMYDLSKKLAEIGGMEEVTLQPAAGAHGEVTGLMIIKSYHEYRNDYKRRNIIVPDSAHGTNPASAATVGFNVIQVESNSEGRIDIAKLKEVINDETAGLMLTNPNTLGLFEDDILEISRLIHESGGLLYYDGANMNAVMGMARPGDMGFDVVHFNLHKTFSTPHGGGGPGSGPVGVKKDLVKFLPLPIIEKKNNKYRLDYNRPESIGKVKCFYGNFGVMVRAYAYILSMGGEGLKQASKMAVLNSNYIKSKLKGYYNIPFDHLCKHEFVLGGLKNGNGVTTLDVAKRLLDYGYHPPTIYFPLIVKESIMIEPTETESKETLDEFIDAMIEIANEAEKDPEILKNAPYNTIIKRVDEVKAARRPIVKGI